MARIVLDIVGNSTGIESALGKTEEAFGDVAKASKNASSEANKGFKQAADSSVSASNAIKDFAGNINIAGVNIGQLGNKFIGAQKSISGLTRGFGLLKAAIVSTGIGALVIALVSLITFFAKTEKGAEFLERATAGLGAAFDVVLGVVTKVGEFIFDAFDNPKQALIDLGNLIKENLINRFTAFGVILDGIINLDFKKVTNGALQLATGVTNVTDRLVSLGKEAIAAGDAAAALAGQFQKLEDAERSNALQISKNQTQIDKLLVQAKNRTLSEEERLKLLDQASKLEEKNLALELSSANARIAIIKGQNKLLEEAGTLRDEDEDKLKDAILKRDELERSSLVLQEKIENRKDGLRQEALDDIARELEAEAKLLEAKKKAADDFANLSKQELDNTLKSVDLETRAEIAAIKSKFAGRVGVEEEQAAEIAAVKLAALQKQLSDLEDYQGSVEGIDTAIAEKKVEINEFVVDSTLIANEKIKKSNEELLELEEAIGQARLDLASTFVSGISGLLSQDEANRKKYGGILKTLALAEIAINLVKEISAIRAANALASQRVAVLGPAAIAANTAKGAIDIAIAIAKAAFGVATIATQKFKKGGYTGDGGTDQEVGIVHGREFVHTAEKTRKHRNLFEAIHSGDYSNLKPIDLRPLLEGTGVSLLPEVASKINNTQSAYSQSVSNRESELKKELSEIKDKMSKFFEYHKGQEKQIGDGQVRVSKKGNTTRIIRKK